VVAVGGWRFYPIGRYMLSYIFNIQVCGEVCCMKIENASPRDPIFEQYNVVDRAVKELVKHIPVNQHEIYYLMETKKQEQIHLVLMGIGFCMIALVYLYLLMG